MDKSLCYSISTPILHLSALVLLLCSMLSPLLCGATDTVGAIRHADKLRGIDVAKYIETHRNNIVPDSIIDGSINVLTHRLSWLTGFLIYTKEHDNSPAALIDFTRRLKEGIVMVTNGDYKEAMACQRKLADDVIKWKSSYASLSDISGSASVSNTEITLECEFIIGITDLICLYCDWEECRHYAEASLADNDQAKALIAYQYLMRIYGDIYLFCDNYNLTDNSLFRMIDIADDEVHAIHLMLELFVQWNLLHHSWAGDYGPPSDSSKLESEILGIVLDNWSTLHELAPYPESYIGDHGYIMASLFCTQKFASLENNNQAYELSLNLLRYIDKRASVVANNRRCILYEKSLYNAITMSYYRGDITTAKIYLEEVLDYYEHQGQRYISHDLFPKDENPYISLLYTIYNEQYLFFLSKYYSACYDLDLDTHNKSFRMPALDVDADTYTFPVATSRFREYTSYRDMDQEMLKDFILCNALDFIGYICELIPQVDALNPDIRNSYQGYSLEWSTLCNYFDILNSLYFDDKGLIASIAEDSPDHINAMGILNLENECFINVLNNGAAPSYYNTGLLRYFEGKYQEAETYLYAHYIYGSSIYQRANDAAMIFKCIEHTGNDEIAAAVGRQFPQEMRDAMYSRKFMSTFSYSDFLWSWGEEACRLISGSFLSAPQRGEFAADVYDIILTFKGYQTQFRLDINQYVERSHDPVLTGHLETLRNIERQYSSQDGYLSNSEIIQAQIHLMSVLEASLGLDILSDHGWQDVRSALGADECAIEFYMPNTESKQTYALVLKERYDYPHVLELNIDSVNVMSESGLSELYSMVWHPLEEELRGVSTVYFSLDRSIDSLPVEYAIDNSGYLIAEKYDCFRLSSTKRLAQKGETTQVSRSAVLYGGLDFDYSEVEDQRDLDIADATRGSADPLLCSLYEVNAISDILASNHYSCTKYTGIEGTEKSFFALHGKKVGILHLATHGMLFDDRTLAEEYADIEGVELFDRLRKSKKGADDLRRSAVALSGCNLTLTGCLDESLGMLDGILTADEVAQIDLSGIDLLVLSCCHSGYYGGADGYGMQRGFKMAGVNSLILTLWEVYDEASQIFMREFYKAYLGGSSKYDALKQAQACLRHTDEYSDPYYWAAFILVDGADG